MNIIGCMDKATGGEEKKSAPKPASNKIDLSNVKDGTYTVESSRDEKLGNVKGENYGSLTGKDSADYKKAQVAVNAIKVYPAQFVETTKRAIEEASK